ncbi:MAG: dipeptidase [Ardenticatenaceae bacterium]|nr:dipeptidase [Ardenticatenaceae bacterium]MCB9443304.1 dipeptidase [Ardenticatenaceae bacterium]
MDIKIAPSKYAHKNQQAHLAELVEFLKIPSISTQPEHDADVVAAAEWMADAMRQAGIENVRLIETPRHPLIYGDWLHAGPDAPTVLIYGHYDVQPPDPLELWQSPPFEPVVKDDYLVARGSSDDKGQAYIHVKAVQAYLETNGRLPVNVKFIIEGEEEIGGASLEAFIPENKELLAADVALVSDTHILSPEQPAIVYGLRGLCYILADITGPDHDLHSGSFGGGINNPINAAAQMIAKLKDENGRILIPGFYDKVRQLSAEEREILRQFPLDEAEWLTNAGAPQIWGEPEFSLVERIGARPTLDVNGIIGGYTAAGRKTVLPSTVHVKISMRLVPDQDPKEIADLFCRYVESILPPSVTVKFDIGAFSPASITDYTIPAMRAASAAYEQVFGKAPVYMREGGSIPVVAAFQSQLGLETVLMGFGLPGDRIHSPNERFYVSNFYKGIQTSIYFLNEYARLASLDSTGE